MERSEHVCDAFHAELSAVVLVVQPAEQLGAIRVVMETDSQLLMLTLNSEVDPSALALVLDDLKFTMHTT